MALRVVDPRGIVVQEQRWDLLGRAMTTLSPDSGFTLVVYDVQGQPVEVRKAGALRVEQEYDTLRRPSRTWVTEGAGPRREVERKVYGEAVPEGDPLAAFARTRLVRVYDTAGRVSVAYDWKGRPVSEERRFWAVAADEVDWSGVPTTWSPTTALLEATAYTTSRSYDALDRPITETTPDGTVTTSTWSIRSLPETVTTGTLPVVSETAYNARGQRTSARLGLAGEQVGVVVAQQWDPTTFRLRRVTARRGTTGPWLQDLRYWYDAVGNPTRLDDAAADEEFFANALVGPGQDFTHDALYRLIAATGREKSGMGWEPAGPAAAVGMPNTMGLWRYRQEYEYDESGNLVEIVHRRGDPLVPGWTRTMVAATTGNRVVSGQLGSDPATTYAYTARGAMTTIETIAGGVEYDFRDQLRHVETNLAGNAAHYLYDGSGRRVRKVVEKSGQTEVRSYVGAYEEWERRVPGTVVDRDGELVDRRTTVHVMDGERRVGMVEVKTHADGEVVSSPTPIARLVLGNVVGSAMLEVTEAGEIISYEEFHPYGTTVYWLESGEVDVSPRRYRYTGQERDEETGLQYHWHRYYAPWLGRWTSADPAGLVDGGNRCQTRPYGSALGEWAPG